MNLSGKLSGKNQRTGVGPVFYRLYRGEHRSGRRFSDKLSFVASISRIGRNDRCDPRYFFRLLVPFSDRPVVV